MPVPKNVAQNIPFALVNNTDGSALTGATVTPYRCLDGGLQLVAAGSIGELGNGQYVLNGAAADFNADYTSAFLFDAANAVPAHVIMQMIYFRKDTAYDIPFLLLNVNTSRGLTGGSPAGMRCLDGQAQEPVAGAFVERGNGQYVFQATAGDFHANNTVGFLFTAAGAVPVHLIIDLLESYSPTDVPLDSPAAIVAHYTTGLGIMTVPSAASLWPFYVDSLPDAPDNAACIFDTTPVKDGRWMRGGAVQQHFGVEVLLRALASTTGWQKCTESY